MDKQGQIHKEQYVLITVKKNTGDAVLKLKNDNEVGFVDLTLEEGANIIFLRPCAYDLRITGDALAGIS